MRSLITLVALSLVLATASHAQTVPQYVPTGALKAWYSFTGNTLDSGGSALNLTNYGATPTADRYGHSNSAYLFDGVGSNMKRAAFPALANPAMVTVSCWIKKSTTGATGNYVVKGASTASANHVGYYLNNNATNTIGGGGFYPDGTNAQVYQNDGGTTSWENVTLAFSNPAFELYVNGSHVGTWNAAFGNVNNYGDDALYIGYTVWAGASVGYFNGAIDDIGIWNRQLTPCEAKKLYSSCVRTTVANQTAPTGSTAVFSFSNNCYSATGITYQWQEDDGTGYANLTNAGQYSGVTTNALSISGLYSANNNAHFRCIISNGVCNDTTNVAILTLGTTGTGVVSKLASVSLFPNPNTGSFTLTYSIPSAGATFNVKDLTGRVVYSHMVSNNSGTENLEISSLDNGIYIWEMSNSNGLLEVGKIVVAR